MIQFLVTVVSTLSSQTVKLLVLVSSHTDMTSLKIIHMWFLTDDCFNKTFLLACNFTLVTLTFLIQIESTTLNEIHCYWLKNIYATNIYATLPWYHLHNLNLLCNSRHPRTPALLDDIYFIIRSYKHESLHLDIWFCVQNALKLTYEHMQLKKFLQGFAHGTPKGEAVRGMQGEYAHHLRGG